MLINDSFYFQLWTLYSLLIDDSLHTTALSTSIEKNWIK